MGWNLWQQREPLKPANTTKITNSAKLTASSYSFAQVDLGKPKFIFYSPIYVISVSKVLFRWERNYGCENVYLGPKILWINDWTVFFIIWKTRVFQRYIGARSKRKNAVSKWPPQNISEVLKIQTSMKESSRLIKCCLFVMVLLSFWFTRNW